MKETKDGNLDKKDLARRFKVSVRSVERMIKRYGLIPCDWHGRQPEFSILAVKAMEQLRLKERLKANGYANGDVITVKEAKRRAGKGAR